MTIALGPTVLPDPHSPTRPEVSPEPHLDGEK